MVQLSEETRTILINYLNIKGIYDDDIINNLIILYENDLNNNPNLSFENFLRLLDDDSIFELDGNQNMIFDSNINEDINEDFQHIIRTFINSRESDDYELINRDDQYRLENNYNTRYNIPANNFVNQFMSIMYGSNWQDLVNEDLANPPANPPATNLSAGSSASLTNLFSGLNLNSENTTNTSQGMPMFFTSSIPNGNMVYYSNFYNLNDINQNSDFLNIFQNLYNMINAQNQENVPLVLTENALKQLDKLDYEQLKNRSNVTEEDTCSICLDKLKSEDQQTLTILKCKHYFHYDCVYEHLSTYDYHCPICKAEVGEHYAKINNEQ